MSLRNVNSARFWPPPSSGSPQARPRSWWSRPDLAAWAWAIGTVPADRRAGGGDRARIPCRARRCRRDRAGGDGGRAGAGRAAGGGGGRHHVFGRQCAGGFRPRPRRAQPQGARRPHAAHRPPRHRRPIRRRGGGEGRARRHLLVRAGEVLPVDGVPLEDVLLDESALTGEPLPVARGPADTVRSGTVNAGEAFRYRASAPADESTYAGIVRMAEAAQTAKAPFIRMADRFAILLLPATLVVAGLAWFVSGDPVRALGGAGGGHAMPADPGRAGRLHRRRFARRAPRHPDEGRRGAGSAGRGAHRDLRQDRHADRGRGAVAGDPNRARAGGGRGPCRGRVAGTGFASCRGRSDPEGRAGARAGDRRPFAGARGSRGGHRRRCRGQARHRRLARTGLRRGRPARLGRQRSRTPRSRRSPSTPRWTASWRRS